MIGYASWGSNDPARKHRFLHFKWLPGAIATEFVSYDGRTFREPPANWEISTWDNKRGWFVGAPQTLAADYIHEGATGASGQVFEPYLMFCPVRSSCCPPTIPGAHWRKASIWVFPD